MFIIERFVLSNVDTTSRELPKVNITLHLSLYLTRCYSKPQILLNSSPSSSVCYYFFRPILYRSFAVLVWPNFFMEQLIPPSYFYWDSKFHIPDGLQSCRDVFHSDSDRKSDRHLIMGLTTSLNLFECCFR